RIRETHRGRRRHRAEESSMHRQGSRRRFWRVALATATLTAVAGLTAAPGAQARVRARTIGIGEYRLAAPAVDQLRNDWVDQILSRYPVHTWAPMRFDLTNADLRLMGLPSKRVLLAHRYR